jgi:DNA-binding response OmpR family regulator
MAIFLSLSVFFHVFWVFVRLARRGGKGIIHSMNVLMVEDDLSLVDVLSRMLTSYGFNVVCCADPHEALGMTRRSTFDVVLLDLTLPGMDGLDWLQNLRDERSRLPVLVMTARSAVGDRVVGLNAGADDYLPKPFDVEELAARLKALVRRSTGVESYRCGALTLDVERSRVLKNQLPLDISGREFALLKALMVKNGQAVSREDLLQAVFGHDAVVGADALEVLVHRLRKRLQGAGVQLVTLRGIGYYVVDEQSIARKA